MKPDETNETEEFGAEKPRRTAINYGRDEVDPEFEARMAADKQREHELITTNRSLVYSVMIAGIVSFVLGIGLLWFSNGNRGMGIAGGFVLIFVYVPCVVLMRAFWARGSKEARKQFFDL